MPAITAITLRFSRKFQISRDDWIGADALVTVAIGDDEAGHTDPAEIRHLAIAEARQLVIETVAAEYLERTQLAARQHAGQLPAGQVASAATAAAAQPIVEEQLAQPANGRPATPEEAERRFFARYGAIVGGESWLDVRAYLAIGDPKPTTIEGWYRIAEAVRDAERARVTPANDVARVPASSDRSADAIADGEVDATPPSHAEQHAVSHQPRPQRQAQPIPTADRARSAARRALK